jgi:hypothetical protein
MRAGIRFLKFVNKGKSKEGSVIAKKLNAEKKLRIRQDHESQALTSTGPQSPTVQQFNSLILMQLCIIGPQSPTVQQFKAHIIN